MGLVLSIFGPQADAQGRVAPVRVNPVMREVVQELRQVTGDVRARQRSEIATREAGLVLELAVREGQRVERGALLGRLDGSRLELELVVLDAERRVAVATVAERKSGASRAERDLNSLRELDARNATNPKELADAKTEYARSLTRVEQAELAIDALDARRAVLAQRLSDMRVLAPFAGVITAKFTEQGQWLAPGDALVELLSDTELEAWFDVPQRFYATLAKGVDEIRVRIDATGGELVATELRFVGAVDPRTRSFAVVADLEPSLPLLPGMSLVGWVPTGAKVEKLTVAADAILRNATGPYVYLAVAGEDGSSRAQLMPVDVLFRLGDRVVISDGGVRAGALAIVEGNERLYPTAPVKPLSVDGSGESGELGE